MTDRERKLRERTIEAPEDAEAVRQLAELVGGQRGRKREAVELWSRYLTVVDASQTAEALLALARAQVEARQVSTAVETLRRCVDEAPGEAEAFDLLGELLRGSGDLEAAAEALRRAVELEPQSIRPRLALVNCLDVLGRSDEAGSELEAVRDMAAGDPALNALVMELVQRRG
jgi:Flp pilus assembly protein TadD